MKLQQLLEEFPPILCRLLVRPAVSNRELARRGECFREYIDFLSPKTSWNTISVSQALFFMSLCGVDILNARRHREFISRANWSHINRSKYYRKLFKLLHEAKNRI